MARSTISKPARNQSMSLNGVTRRVRRFARELNFDYPTRVLIAASLIALLALLSTSQQLSADWREYDPSAVGRDGVSLYEKRFDAVKALLPASGVVGYISDTPTDSAEFYLTQYALSPLIVDATEPHQLVIGNFVNKAASPKTLGSATLVLRRDFGNGVKLFETQ